jgi:hypothetical protein
MEASTNQVAEKHTEDPFSFPWKIPCEVVNIELMVHINPRLANVSLACQ